MFRVAQITCDCYITVKFNHLQEPRSLVAEKPNFLIASKCFPHRLGFVNADSNVDLWTIYIFSAQVPHEMHAQCKRRLSRVGQPEGLSIVGDQNA